MSGFLESLFNNKLWHRIIIICFSFVIYSNTLRNDFVLDDNIVLKKNEFVKKGFSGIGDILKYDTFKGFFLNDQSGVIVTGGRYRPATLVFFACVYPIFGLNPMYYHLISILFYILLSLVIYEFVISLLKVKFSEYSILIAFFAALLFSLHPLHTEVVSNIKGLDEIFSLLFSLLASISLFRFLDQKKVSHLLFGFIYFFIALMSKESAVNFVLLIPVAFYFFRKVNYKEFAVGILPLIISTSIYLFIRFLVIGFQVYDTGTRDVLTNPFLKIRGTNVIDATLIERMGMIFYSLGKYLQLMIFPHPLTHDYFPMHVSLQALFTPAPLLSLFVFIGLIILAFLQRIKRPILSFALILLVIPLITISNLIIPMGTPMGERFAFTSSLGFCLLIAFLLYKLALRNKNWTVVVLGLTVFLFSFKVWTRNVDWKDEYALFSKDVQISKNSIKAHSEIAYHLVEKIKVTTDTSLRKAFIAEAIPHLEKTVQLYPRHANALYLLGNLNYMKKDYEKAASTYDRYLELVPSGKDVLRNLQVCYREYGRSLAMKSENLDKAVEVLIRSLKLNPNDARLMESLGIAYGNTKEFELSIEYFNKAMKLDPNNGMILVNLGNVYYMKGDKTKGSEYIKAAYKMDSGLGAKLLNMEKPKIH